MTGEWPIWIYVLIMLLCNHGMQWKGCVWQNWKFEYSSKLSDWYWLVSATMFVSPPSISGKLVKRLMVNCDTPRQYLNSNRTDFWYSSLFGVTWPSNWGCFAFRKQILPLTRSRLAVMYGAYFYVLCLICHWKLRAHEIYWTCVRGAVTWKQRRIEWRWFLALCSVMTTTWSLEKSSCRFVFTFLQLQVRILVVVVVIVLLVPILVLDLKTSLFRYDSRDLTLWRPLLPYGYSYKESYSCARPV